MVKGLQAVVNYKKEQGEEIKESPLKVSAIPSTGENKSHNPLDRKPIPGSSRPLDLQKSVTGKIDATKKIDFSVL